MSMNSHAKNGLRALAALPLFAGLTACGPGTADLQAYIDEVMARPGGRIEPLPEIRPAPTFSYVAEERRPPFTPDESQRRVSSNPNAVDSPNTDRPREYLEQFSLDTMRMVGTLSGDTGNYGLVQTADGLVHSVSIGNHLGQNYGRITAISDSEIQLVEIIPDGLGGFLERPAGIGLSD